MTSFINLLHLILTVCLFGKNTSEKTKLKLKTRLDTTDWYDYNDFQSFELMEKELNRIEKQQKSPLKITKFSIGKTFEKRHLWSMKFELKPHTNKKTIVIDCGAHAREWLAPSTCMFLIQQFSEAVTNENENDSLDVLKNYNLVIIPLLNPDGYVYTWHNDTTRLWRKNRSYTKKQKQIMKTEKDPMCIGVDINRNFDKAWGGPGAPVDNPCYEMYAGDEPFSEKESSALAKYLTLHKNNIIAYVTLHAFGQSWMTPWGFTKKKPKTYSELARVGKIAVNAMKRFSGIKFTVGTSYKELYPNSGSTTDWAYGKLHIPYSYLVEMIPTDLNNLQNFILSPQKMIKNAQNMLVALTAMCKALKADR